MVLRLVPVVYTYMFFASEKSENTPPALMRLDPWRVPKLYLLLSQTATCTLERISVHCSTVARVWQLLWFPELLLLVCTLRFTRGGSYCPFRPGAKLHNERSSFKSEFCLGMTSDGQYNT